MNEAYDRLMKIRRLPMPLPSLEVLVTQGDYFIHATVVPRNGRLEDWKYKFMYIPDSNVTDIALIERSWKNWKIAKKTAARVLLDKLREDDNDT
jgi:hypothetical protein